MNEIIFDMIKPYLDMFDTYPVSSPSLQKQVDDFKQKMLAFADTQSDVTVFYTKLTESGLQEESTALITKVAMASMGSADTEGNVKTDYSDAAAAPVISVHEFVEQYRIAYNEVKKAGYRKRGEAAYEQIFAVADKTEDMLDAQIMMERERLLWKIVSDDSLDTLEAVLKAMDPLQPAMTATLEKHIEAYQKAQGVEEIDYALERLEFEKTALTRRATSRMAVAVQMTTLLLGYFADKSAAQLTGGQGKSGEERLRAMIAFRSAAKRALRFLKEDLGLTFDDLLADESLKIWLLAPENTDHFGRIKIAMNPQNYEVFRDIVNNEILPDLSTPELLMQVPDKAVWYAFDDGAPREAFRKKAADKAKQLNAYLTYYQYQDQLDQAAGEYAQQA